MDDAVKASIEKTNKTDIKYDDFENNTVSELYNWEDDLVGAYLLIVCKFVLF